MLSHTLFLSVLLILGACSKAQDVKKRRIAKTTRTEPVKKPVLFETFYETDEKNFVRLPMRGDVRDQKHFWSGDFWPHKKGSINRRWNAGIRIGFNHRSPTREQLFTMTPEKIAELAPSEKYDLLMGAYDYPLRKDVSRLAADENAEMWEGMINGWAVASLLHYEPRPKTLINPDGVEIPFGSEDIKGLLAYYYSYHQKPEIEAMVGRPCLQRGCPDDLTAASFHMALANMLGKKKKPFLMDLDRTRDIWNHPVVAYESEYRGNVELHSKVTPGTHTIVRLKTTVTYIDEALNQTWAPTIGTSNQLETKQVYEYWLHLDVNGEIIGSEWKSNERPDYLWTVKEVPAFSGILEGLAALVDDPGRVIDQPEEIEPEFFETEMTE